MLHRRSRRFTLLALAWAPIVAVLLLIEGAPLRAAGTVTNCANDTQLSAKLQGGGLVTFDCGKKTIVLGSTLSITHDTTIDGGGNITLSGGNAVQLFHISDPAKVTFKNITLTLGYCNCDGGAVADLSSGRLTLDHVTMSHNLAVGSGGAIYTTSPLTITHSTLHHNIGANGGALYPRFPQAVVTIANSRLHHNVANSDDTGWGGAILLWDGATLKVTDSDLYGNSAHQGGAINNRFANSSVTLTDSWVRDNQATGRQPGGTGPIFDGNGAGIYNASGNATLLRVTMTYNNAGGPAGGGAIWNSGNLKLTNVTLSGNHSDGPGGAVENQGAATLRNVTITANTSPDAGVHSGGAIGMTNVIVEKSYGTADCDLVSTPDPNLFNLADEASCPFGTGRINVDPLLGPLDTNGGSLLTHRLLPGSPARDGGTGVGCPGTDERGVSRPKGAACDVGALEFVPCTGKPPASSRVSPAIGARVGSGKVYLDWAGPDCAIAFRVVVRKGSSTGHVVWHSVGGPASVTLVGPFPPGTYYWRISPCNQHGCRAGSYWSFKTS